MQKTESHKTVNYSPKTIRPSRLIEKRENLMVFDGNL